MEYREVALLVVVGAVLPVATIVAVLSATATYGFHWAVPFFLLLASPLIAAGSLYVKGVRAGSLQTPSWLPTGRPEKFADRIPARHHENFAPETLDQEVTDEAAPSGRVLALVLIYLVSIPVYTVVLWGLFG